MVGKRRKFRRAVSHCREIFLFFSFLFFFYLRREGKKRRFYFLLFSPRSAHHFHYIVTYIRVGVFQRNRGFSVYISPHYRYRITIKTYVHFSYLSNLAAFTARFLPIEYYSFFFFLPFRINKSHGSVETHEFSQRVERNTGKNR